VIPKFAEQTDFQVIEMMAGENQHGAKLETGPDPVAEGQRGADTSFSWFDRDFAQWYWSLMAADE
jgi:hypothetical protein